MNYFFKNFILTPFNVLYKLNPELDLRILFRIKTGKKLNLKNPVTYSEKIQWIKLYDKNKLMPRCCDKFTVREYVSSCGLQSILNELLWQGFNPEVIPFDKLPNRFVIKVTHGSTFNIICKDKASLDRDKTIAKLSRWLKAKFLPCYGEWFYGIEKPRIIIEKFLENDNGEQIKDYKVYCFNGEPRYISVDSGRFTSQHYQDVYNTDWMLLEKCEMGYKSSGNAIPKPNCLDKMLDYAKVLSKKFLHARVDFYIVENEIYFGEITFTDGAGFDKITPHNFNIEMGNWLNLKE